MLTSNQLIEHRTHNHHRLIALLLIVAAAAIVGYAAWQAGLIFEQQQEFTADPVPAPETDPAGVIYFTYAPSGTTTVETAAYDVEEGSWTTVLSYPGYYGFAPFSATEAFVTLPNIEVDPSELTAENSLLPAYFEMVNDEFVYLETVPGYAEQHYRLAPVEDAPVAYMQRSEAGTSTDIADWDVVIFNGADDITTISGAAYPEWVTDVHLTLLRPEGLVIYDTRSDSQTVLALPYEGYSLANQYTVHAPSDRTSQIVMTATDQNQYSVLEELVSEEGESIFDSRISTGRIDSVFTDPVTSPDGSYFALLQQTTATGSDALTATINIYSYATLEQVTSLPLEEVEAGALSIDGWR